MIKRLLVFHIFFLSLVSRCALAAELDWSLYTQGRVAQGNRTPRPSRNGT